MEKTPQEQAWRQSARELAYQLAYEEYYGLRHQPQTRRTREVIREAHVVDGEVYIREREIEVEDTINAPQPMIVEAPKQQSWIDRLLGGKK